MGYSVIICQRADHLLIKNHAAATVQYSTSLGQRVGLATYDQADTAWLVRHVDSLLEQAGPGDVVFVADHDTINRYPGDSSLVRAEYTIGDTALSGAVRRVLNNEDSAISELLAWFWAESRDLPPAGIASLTGCVAKSGVSASLWTLARQGPHIRRALRWFSLLAPNAAQEEGCQLAAELLSRTDPVSLADHQKVQSWLNGFEPPEAAVFQRFCLGHDWTPRQ